MAELSFYPDFDILNFLKWRLIIRLMMYQYLLIFFSLLEKIMIVLTGLIFGRIQYVGNWCTTEIMMRLCKYLASEDLSTRVNKNKLFW